MKRYLGILGYIRFGYRLGFGDGIGNYRMNDELSICLFPVPRSLLPNL